MADLLNAVFNPVGFVSNIVNGIERMVSSPEHNFKKDLDNLLEGVGVPEGLRKEINDLLNSGKDQEIGEKLRALMSAGIIPTELQEQIGQLADQNGVPNSSIDRGDMARPIDDTEMIDHWLGEQFRDCVR